MSFTPYKSTFTPFRPAEPAPSGVPFPSSRNDNPLQAGIRATGNLPSSFGNFVGGIKDMVLNPIDTLSGIGNAVLGGVGKVANVPNSQKEQEVFNQLGTALKDRYGSLDNLQKTATEDPFGFGADVLGVLEGGAGLLGKTAQFNTLVGTTGRVVTQPVTRAVSATARGVSKATEFGVSQATGLNPETLRTVTQNPQAFSASGRANIDRTSLAGEVKTSLDKRLTDLKDTGSGYDTIRNSEGAVSVPQGTIESVLSKYGIKLQLDEAGRGRVVTTPESRPLSQTDRTAIEDFYNNYGQERQLSNNAFLNTREALSNLSKFEQGKTSVPTAVARELRAAYDDLGKTQIKGLGELDAAYSPEVSLLKQAKKDFFNPDGSLKDAAISKIANATGRGKDQLLRRLEDLNPGITQRIKVLKAVEDIEHASGLKVGTYARAIGVGGQAAMGNIPGAIITAILTAPEVAVPLIRGYGLTKPQVAKVLVGLRSAGNDVNNFRIPASLKNSEGQVKAGLSMDDVSGKTLTPFERKVLGVKDGAKPNIPVKRAIYGYDSHSGLPLDSSGMIDKALAKNFKTSYFESLRQAAAKRGNSFARSFPEDFIKKIREAYVEETNTRRSNRAEDGGRVLEKERASMSHKTAGFERAKGLSPKDAEIETKAFEKVAENEQEMINRNIADNGKVVNTDDFRKQFKDVGYVGTNAAAVHEPSSYLAAKAFTKALKENEGEFMLTLGGGSGAGKSSGVKNLPTYQEIYKDSAVVLDSNFSKYDSAMRKINEGRAAGKTPVHIYVYRDSVESLIKGIVARMKNNPDEMGRIVPTKVAAENHIGSLEVAKKLRDNGVEVIAVDNSYGLGKSREVSLDEIVKKANYPSVEELTNKFNDEIRKIKGELTPEQYQGYIQ